MTGLIISNPPPGPVTASPVTKERLFIKYLCKTSSNQRLISALEVQ